MGYIDADAHVMEISKTWSYFDPGERHYGPPEDAAFWQVEDFVVQPDMVPRDGDYRIYPDGAQDLENVPARLAHMDNMDVDVQICFSTFWLMHPLQDPLREAAMQRSWNRWMAERTGESAGRLRWLCQIPDRIERRAREELRFAKDNGAVGMETTGLRHGLPLGHPVYWPLFELLQDFDMTLAVHIGASYHTYNRNPQGFYYSHVLPVAGAFANLLAMDIPRRFPRLRIAFCEAGGSWVPHALSESFRSNDSGSARVWGDWRARSREYLQEASLYVACLLDDDWSYLADYIGADRMMVGSDYSHIDAGTDPDALRIAAARTDTPGELLRAMTGENARRCFGLS